MVESCIKARLLAIKEDDQRKIYVFHNQITGEFVMCTRCPNWQGEEPKMFQEGFVTYKKVRAYHDQYYNANEGREFRYKQNAIYFENFVPTTHILNNGFVQEANKLIVE